MLRTDGKRNSPSFFVYLVRALCDHPLWQGSRQAINPLVSIPAAADQVLVWWSSKSPNLMLCEFFSYGDKLRTPSFYCLYHRICLSCKDEALLPSQKLIMTSCSRYGWKWIIDLMSAMLRLWEGGVSLSICSFHVTILTNIHMYHLYETCQGIINNPVFLILSTLAYT
jgi:hypothetical protein